MNKEDRAFKIPEYEYFEMGGKYSGSKRGMELDDFSFRITPKEEITVQIWYDAKCFDLSETVAENVFEQSRDGYHEMLDWIEEQYKEWLKEHTPRSSELGYFSKPPEYPDWLLEEWARQAEEKARQENAQAAQENKNS